MAFKFEGREGEGAEWGSISEPKKQHVKKERKKERKGRRGLPSSSRSSMPQLPLGIRRKRSTTKDSLKFTISKPPFVALNDGARNDTK
jgi:hypothetical protein